jgi:hypothetical protein
MALLRLLLWERVNMKKLAIVGISLLAVVFLVLCSQSSVVGYRVVKDSQEKLVKESVSKIDKIKTNLLTLESLFTNGKQSTGIKYTVLAILHYFMYFILIVIILFKRIAAGLPYCPSPDIRVAIVILLLSSLFSMAASIPLAMIWPLVDLFIYLEYRANHSRNSISLMPNPSLQLG